MASDRRSARHAARSAARGALWGLAVVHVVEAAVLRRRRDLLRPLPGAGAGAGAASARAASAHDLADKVDVVAVAGGRVDAATAAAARQEMDAAGAQVLDLVPGDLPADRALRLLRRVEPDRMDDPFYTPGGAHEALAVDPSVTARAGRPQEAAPDRGAMVRATLRAQRYAPRAAQVRLAPSLRAVRASGADRWRELEELTAYAQPYGALAPLLVGAETVHLAAMTAGALVSPAAAAAALVSWSAQPSLVFGGATERGRAKLRPPGLAGASVKRLPRAWADNARTVVAGWRRTRARMAARRAAPVPAPPPQHTLFEPRRDTCYWCGSHALVGRLDVTDLLQHKPGTFHLDECADCGHVFQNPALTVAGLDHFYEHAYDGLGEELAEVSFAALGKIYRNRVEALARFAEPRAWLDVGTGHAHFLLAARQRWPEATFDALDMSDSVSEAARRGRVDTAYRGMFPELAGRLPRTYDVVSMHHYLEHTRDPKGELAAAARVLEAGGHLMIEVPDPQAPWARRLGRYWWQWGQPQHQHFMTCDNLVAALGELGFEVVSVERGPATMGGELFNAIGLVLQHLVRSPHLPWLPVPSLAHRAARVALYGSAVPAMLVAKAADEVKDALLGADDVGNAYRLVARRA